MKEPTMDQNVKADVAGGIKQFFEPLRPLLEYADKLDEIGDLEAAKGRAERELSEIKKSSTIEVAKLKAMREERRANSPLRRCWPMRTAKRRLSGRLQQRRRPRSWRKHKLGRTGSSLTRMHGPLRSREPLPGPPQRSVP